MNESSVMPNPDSVYDLYTGAYKIQLVRAALLLDVFTPLESGPASAEIVAQACQADARGIRVLLDYLASLRVLERDADSYALTPTAATFLVRGRKTYAGDTVLTETAPSLGGGILHALRSGQPSHHTERFDQDAWLESYSSWRPAKSLEMWRAAGIEPGRRPGLRVLDLASGCAIKSLVLAQADPTARITCLDRAEVLEVARDLAHRLNVLSQVTFRPDDLFAADLGERCFDAVLMGQISYYLTPTQNTNVFRRVYAALTPGSVFVIDAIMPSEPPSEYASLVTALLWAVSGGAAHSFADYGGWLEQIGFRDVRQLSERWLAAIKPSH